MRKLIITVVVVVALSIVADRSFFKPYRDYQEQKKIIMHPAAPGGGVLSADEQKAKILREEGPDAAYPPGIAPSSQPSTQPVVP